MSGAGNGHDNKGHGSAKGPSGPPRPGGGFGPGHGPGMMAMPGQKAKNFKGSLKRLLVYLKPFTLTLILVLAAAILSTIFSIASPKILGRATDLLFDGMMAKIKGIPGAAIDFEGIAFILALLAGLYIISALFGFIQQYLDRKSVV